MAWRSGRALGQDLRDRVLADAGRPAREVLGLQWESESDHIETALEWGVRVLDKPVTVHAEGDRPEPAKADIFPAYDDDGGLLLVLTPQ